jgi:hypothetical protein
VGERYEGYGFFFLIIPEESCSNGTLPRFLGMFF